VLGAIVMLHAGAVVALQVSLSERPVAPETVAPMLIANLAPAAAVDQPAPVRPKPPPPPLPATPKPKPKPKPDTHRPVPTRPAASAEPARPTDSTVAAPAAAASIAEASAPAEAGDRPPPPPVQHPAAISCRVPPYPAEARRQGQTGTVLLGLLIDETGAVTDRRIERTSGSDALDLAALTALSSCRFSPGTVDGRPHAAWARLRYVWKLN